MNNFYIVCFQRPLIKYSLVKDAVPSIFIQDVRDEDVKKIKKRKIATSDPENTNQKGIIIGIPIKLSILSLINNY